MSELLMSQLAATNMVYKKFSFDYFLDSMDRLGVHRLELYGCSHHFHMYDGDPNMAANMRKNVARISASSSGFSAKNCSIQIRLLFYPCTEITWLMNAWL